MLVEKLYSTHQKELIRFAKAIARNEKEAEDLLQETFLRALGNSEKLSGLRDYQQRAWLYKVLRNILHDRRRRDRFETPFEDKFQPAIEANDIANLEMKEMLETLPPKFYDIVYKRYWHGITANKSLTVSIFLTLPFVTVFNRH
ncbi:RNA polymerase sigma factor [Alkalihalobacillus sp. AL-G]|nr:RNA polymerase sigma factor [Alkalihalobacillus sp. AL-G]WLD94360.1 RNA polymerase sigma factor [Alkalihalobacillus sp. AL-G]